MAATRDVHGSLSCGSLPLLDFVLLTLLPPTPTLPQWVPAEQLPVRYGGQCATPLGESELELRMAAYVRGLNEQAEARAAGGKGETSGAAADEAWHDAAGEAAVGASSNVP